MGGLLVITFCFEIFKIKLDQLIEFTHPLFYQKIKFLIPEKKNLFPSPISKKITRKSHLAINFSNK